jgi:hypothetical protein
MLKEEMWTLYSVLKVHQERLARSYLVSDSYLLPPDSVAPIQMSVEQAKVYSSSSVA